MKRSAAIAGVVVLAAAGGCLTVPGLTDTTLPEVERRIDRGVPLGSTRLEVEAWLDGRGIEHGFYDDPRRNSSLLAAVPGIDRYPTAVVAILRHANKSLLASESFQMFFLFDAEGRFRKRIVSSVLTGL